MKKLGRPKLDVNESQRSCVSVWLTADEKERVRMAARAARMPASAWAGKVLTDAAKRALEVVGL